MPSDDDVPEFDEDVPGFPRCERCRYRLSGPPQQCVLCAHQTLDPVSADHCVICGQTLEAGQACHNSLCRSPNRAFTTASPIAMKLRNSPLEQTIYRYKYEKRAGWAFIFARLLLGHLDRTMTPDDVDLIVASPTWTGPPDNRFAHTEAVIDRAAIEDTRRRWPFDAKDPRAIIATGPRSRSAGGGIEAKHRASLELSRLLDVPHPGWVEGQRIVIYDDVFTTGYTLQAVARKLRQAGAVDVSAIVLARQPWGT